jgi:hypothetical protein
MLGRAAGRHGSCCGGPPGPDCADYYKGKKAQRAYEKRQWRREECMSWQVIKNFSLNGEAAKHVNGGIPTNNYAVDGYLDGSWFRFRVQKEENGEVIEYAVPYTAVNYITFW